MISIVMAGPTLHGCRGQVDTPPQTKLMPPARRGDIYRAVKQGVRVIGLIDGYFRTVPSVLHKEILWALDQGCAVYGAASMGALRAAELHRFGMIGVGSIFEDFRDGRLWRDDEVAVTHGPAELGFPPLSEALVNIRYTLASAVAAGRLSDSLARDLVQTARRMPYSARSLTALAQANNASPDSGKLASDELEWLVRHRIDQKALDARALLSAIGYAIEGGAPPSRPAFEFEDTIFYQRFRDYADNPLTRELA